MGADSERPVQGELFEADHDENRRRFLEALTSDQVAAGARNVMLRLCGTDGRRCGESTFLNWLNPHNENDMPSAKLLRLAGARLIPGAIAELCRIAGGVFVPLPQTRAAALNATTIQTLQGEMGALIAALSNVPPGDEETARLHCVIVMRGVTSIMKGLERP